MGKFGWFLSKTETATSSPRDGEPTGTTTKIMSLRPNMHYSKKMKTPRFSVPHDNHLVTLTIKCVIKRKMREIITSSTAQHACFYPTERCRGKKSAWRACKNWPTLTPLKHGWAEMDIQRAVIRASVSMPPRRSLRILDRGVALKLLGEEIPNDKSSDGLGWATLSLGTFRDSSGNEEC